MGVNTAIFYSGYHLKDIAFTTIVANIILMGVFSLLVAYTLTILSRFSGGHDEKIANIGTAHSICSLYKFSILSKQYGTPLLDHPL